MEKHISPFSPYGHDLTTSARRGQFEPRLGVYEAEIARIFQILSRQAKNHVAVLDRGDGTGWQVATEVIRRLAIGDAPEALCSLRAVALDCDALVAGIPDVEKAKQIHQELRSGKGWKVADDPLERPLLKCFRSLRHHPERVLLVIEQLPRFLGAEWDTSPLEGRNHLFSALLRRQVQLLTACDVQAYRQWVGRDAALERCIQVVSMPSLPDTF